MNEKLLSGILFAEFDHILGPKVIFQVPENAVKSEAFEHTHEYFITKPNLCDRLMIMHTYNYKIAGYPVIIHGSKYPRNYYMFNVCFVFAEEEEQHNNSPSILLQPIVRKLALALKQIEKESELLSNPKNRAQLLQILNKIYADLNNQQEAIVNIDEANTLYLKIFPNFSTPTVVYEYHVPVFIQQLDDFGSDICEWDITLQQIIPFIDGVNHVDRISQLSGVRLDVTKNAIQHLLFTKAIFLTDIFQYSNMYCTTPLISRLFEDSLLQHECLSFVVKSDQSPPNFDVVFRLYCGLKSGVTLREYCIENESKFQLVDERRFILFGVLNGFIRRIHKYPLFLMHSDVSHAFFQKKDIHQDLPLQMFDGNTSYDKLCCNLGISHDVLDAKIKADKDVVTLCL